MSVAMPIDSRLREALPPRLHTHVPALARLLESLANGSGDAAEVTTRLQTDADLAPLAQALGGQQIQCGKTMVSFGQGNTIDDVTTGDIAGGDIINLTIHVKNEQSSTLPILAPERPPIIEPFVGREAELEAFGKRLERVHVVWIVGMAGVGKTSLATMLARRHPRRRHGSSASSAMCWRVAATARRRWCALRRGASSSPALRVQRWRRCGWRSARSLC